MRHKTQRLLVMFPALVLLSSCSESSVQTPVAQAANSDIEYVAILSSLTGTSPLSIEPLRAKLKADFYQLPNLSSAEDINTSIGFPEPGCHYEATAAQKIPWQYDLIKLSEGNSISVGEQVDLKLNGQPFAQLGQSNLGSYELPNPYAVIENSEATATLTADQLPFELSKELDISVMEAFYVSVITSGEHWWFVNGSVPEYYSLDFSLEWPIKDHNNTGMFIMGWKQKQDGSFGSVSCYIEPSANVGTFTIPADIRLHAQQDGLANFDNIYVARANYNISIDGNVMLVKSSEIARNLFKGFYPTF